MGRSAGGRGGPLGPETRLGVNRSGVWEIRWTEWDAAAGRARSRSQSCGTTDRAIAEQVRQAWVVAGLQVQAVVGGGLTGTVEDLVTAYMRDRGFARGSSVDWSLRPIVAALGGRAVGDLGPSVLADYRDARALRVAGATIRRELVQLKAVLEWGRRSGMVPADCKPEVTLPPDGAARTAYLDEDQEARVWAAAEALVMGDKPFRERRVGLFVCLALETAAREAAIRGLTWDRVDTRAWVIDFRDPNMAVTKKRRVPVPVSDRLRPVLERVKAQAEVEDRGGKWVLRSDGAIKKGFEGFRGRLGLDWLTVHDLRRTWASLRMQWGVPIEEVAGVLGDTVEVVSKHYAHFAPGYLRSAVNARPKKGA